MKVNQSPLHAQERPSDNTAATTSNPYVAPILLRTLLNQAYSTPPRPVYIQAYPAPIELNRRTKDYSSRMWKCA